MILNVIADELPRTSKDDFKDRIFRGLAHRAGVPWHLRYLLSCRDLECIFVERGFDADHGTISHRALACAPMVEV